jgi:hypothetical protein
MPLANARHALATELRHQLFRAGRLDP